jgi:hypothetical protein
MLPFVSEPHFRAFERRPLNLPVRLHVASRPLDGRVVNLGLGGAGVETRGYVSIGTKLEVELETPTLWDPLKLEARVTWLRETADGFVLGVCFRHESSRATGSLLGLLRTEAYS